ncbi:unnamed protein product [Lasius platythorax]|uniref:Uncharacterized protein n=1 Tax=Lasius platythorax TaxID=488582 RepID=A0AAV2P8H4_9HYME
MCAIIEYKPNITQPRQGGDEIALEISTLVLRLCVAVAGQSVAAVAGALACPHLTLRDRTSETTRLDRERMLGNAAGDIPPAFPPPPLPFPSTPETSIHLST